MTKSAKAKLQTTRQQHIVPKCYLKNWCNDDGRIHAFKLAGAHRSTPSPKNAATREHIYDTLATLNPSDPESYQIFERTLGRIEDEIPGIFDSILSNCLASIVFFSVLTHFSLAENTEAVYILNSIAGEP